jgi:hypothetical protein
MLAFAWYTLRLVSTFDHPLLYLSYSLCLHGTLRQFMQPLYVMGRGVSTEGGTTDDGRWTTDDGRREGSRQ